MMLLPPRSPFRLEDAVAVAKLWRMAGGRAEVELGALEPLLWRQERLGPADLVKALVAAGVRVTMTTNGSLLAKMARDLKNAALSLLRISWHTTNAATFRDISGQGDYAEFRAGIRAAADAGLPISFNRVLLRGSTEDIPEQLDFIEDYGLRLKFYDLLWTPAVDSVYRNTYQDWRPVVREYVLPRTKRLETVRGRHTRDRIRFHLKNDAVVEVKLGESVDRSRTPCRTCSHRTVCLEEFGDYLRVEPELDVYACYLRRDIGFSLREIVHSGADAAPAFRLRLREMIAGSESDFLASSRLRYIVVPFCNFNCVIPGTAISWCHKTSGDYSFPGRPRSRSDEGKEATK